MTDELPEIRKSHPYVMYDMMKDIPNGIKATRKIMENFDYSYLSAPLYLTGNGTAFHSAAIGGQILRKSKKIWHAIQSFELENYYEPLGVVIGLSHTGKTKSTVDSLVHSRKYATTVAVTHYPNTPLTKSADYSVVIGNSPDLSLCNTKAFFDNAAAILEIAKNYGGLKIDLDPAYDGVVSAVSNLDDAAKSIAMELIDVERVFVLGAGPNYFVAREAAQKIKESNHMHAEGIELEEFNHGCTAVVDDRTLIIIIATSKVMRRVEDIVRASKTVGAPTFVINGEGDYSIYTDGPEDEFLSPVVNMVPLYYLAYHMAVSRGKNPDYLRFEDKKYLDFDSIIFPPGAH